jgi:tetratricopeptide (TPR) repeat protein
MKKVLFVLISILSNFVLLSQTTDDSLSDKHYNISGVNKQKVKDYRGAILDFNKAIELNPENKEAFFERGMSKSKLKDYRGAILDFNKAIELYTVSVNFCVERHLQDSAEFWSKILAKVYYNRGLCKMKLNLKDGACLDFSKSGELGFKNAYEQIAVYCN